MERKRWKSARTEERKKCAQCGPHLDSAVYSTTRNPHLNLNNAKQRTTGSRCWSNRLWSSLNSCHSFESRPVAGGKSSPGGATQSRPARSRRRSAGYGGKTNPSPVGAAHPKALESHEVRAYLGVSVLGRPKVQGHGCDFVHQRYGVAVHRHVHRFQIVLAGIAGFDPRSGEIFRRIARQLLIVFLAAERTQYPPELPLCQTERTHQKPLSTVALGMQDGDLRFSAAHRTNRTRESRKLRRRGRGKILGIRLEQDASEERTWPGVVAACQEIGQHLTLLFRRSSVDLRGLRRQFRGAALLDQREQGR